MQGLKEELIFPNLVVSNYVEAIRLLGNSLYNANLVKSTFVEAVMSREEVYPTGLNFGKYGVAIPHTDTEHVKQQSMAIAILQKPITFKSMGDAKKDISVNVVLLLANKEANQQIDQLSTLIELFSDKMTMEHLVKSKNAREVVQILQNFTTNR